MTESLTLYFCYLLAFSSELLFSHVFYMVK